MAISKRAGFACVAGACVALTGTAFAGGGDDPFTAVTITALPFSDAGSTTGLTNQFDVVCPFSGSTSPDAWYSYTPGADTAISATTCTGGSAYDTKLYVLDTGFNDIACNDDGCTDDNGNAFRSVLTTGNIAAGTQVFIVVDGYLGDLGDYNLTVEGVEPCVLDGDCPAGSTDEGELCDEIDDINGGCNTTPTPIFSNVVCGETVCGTAWANAALRDTDWYILPAQAATTQITYTVTGEFDGAYFYLGENPDCGTVAVVTAVNPAPCETAEIVEVASGETWWFAGAGVFEGFPCAGGSNEYIVSWECSTDIPPTPCPSLGDSNSDGFVDFDDLLAVIANFGPCP